jgi:outer membrane receptor protein involved in Fe transport
MQIVLVMALALIAWPASAQQTTGTIAGVIVDDQGAAVPGATVTAHSVATGFTRTTTTSTSGLYTLPALPVGAYDVVADLPGFTTVELHGIVVRISETHDLNMTLRVAQLAETVTVTAEAPLVSTTSSSVGQVVDLERIESLPLNGRQFANLAATVPGVSLGFHSDLTKPTQYTPQISGGNGRNVNYLIDGGDNNDDTVGGLLQLFPLEAIEEFNVITQRFKAEFGRSDGAVLNVVTKSGTNQLGGSWFTLLRDQALNARTMTETITNVDKQPYRRYQFGGSVGGPIVMNRAHYFAAYERTHQDTRQAVNTLGLFPEDDGVFDTPYRENLFTTKVTASVSPRHYLALRYGRNTNSQAQGASLRAARSSWTNSINTFDSTNFNHNWLAGDGTLNELVVQYAQFRNEIAPNSMTPQLVFPNGVTAGTSLVAPQSTEQHKWQFRDDVSWTVGGLGGVGHTLKAGVNWIHEPHLFITTTAGIFGQFLIGTNDVNGPVQQVFVIGGASEVNFPLDIYSLYAQDDWRATSRLTLNLGMRWDYVDGMPINQDANPNFLALQAAGRAGRFAGTALEDFGKTPQGDRNNIQPRLGLVYDVRGNGRDVVRGGWGIYTDFAYTNANALTPGIDAAGGSGLVFFALNPAGLRKPDGTLFRASDPLSAIASLNTVNPNVPPLTGQVLSPRIEQPHTYQTNAGWTHALGDAMAVTVDYVRVEGRDLNIRLRPNMLISGRRALADLPIQPNSAAFRTAISKGESQHDAVTFGIRRRLSRGFDVNGWYSLSKSTSDIGTASDELDQNLVQDVTDPFGPVQDAPSMRTDARHRVTVTAIIEAPWGIRVAPFVMYRSGLPVHTFEGLDLNADGNLNDKTALAYAFTGLHDDGRASVKEDGPCETVNCSRRAPFSQVNLRVSRSFAVRARFRIEAIGEVFNLLNATNPFIPLTTRRFLTPATPNPAFMQPTAFAGDFQQPEQRVGQVGFRITF